MWLLIMEKHPSEIRNIYIGDIFSGAKSHWCHFKAIGMSLTSTKFHHPFEKINLVKRTIAINSPHVDVDDCGIFCNISKELETKVCGAFVDLKWSDRYKLYY